MLLAGVLATLGGRRATVNRISAPELGDIIWSFSSHFHPCMKSLFLDFVCICYSYCSGFAPYASLIQVIVVSAFSVRLFWIAACLVPVVMTPWCGILPGKVLHDRFLFRERNPDLTIETFTNRVLLPFFVVCASGCGGVVSPDGSHTDGFRIRCSIDAIFLLKPFWLK